jgi:hypothetical protein
MNSKYPLKFSISRRTYGTAPLGISAMMSRGTHVLGASPTKPLLVMINCLPLKKFKCNLSFGCGKERACNLLAGLVKRIVSSASDVGGNVVASPH